MAFQFDKLEFKDSFAFLSSSLDNLVKLNKYIKGSKRDNWFKNFRYSNQNPYVKNLKDLDLLTDKGVYPYDYMNSWGKI